MIEEPFQESWIAKLLFATAYIGFLLHSSYSSKRRPRKAFAWERSKRRMPWQVLQGTIHCDRTGQIEIHSYLHYGLRRLIPASRQAEWCNQFRVATWFTLLSFCKMCKLQSLWPRRVALWRIVFDEAHYIKNKAASTSQMCALLAVSLSSLSYGWSSLRIRIRMTNLSFFLQQV